MLGVLDSCWTRAKHARLMLSMRGPCCDYAEHARLMLSMRGPRWGYAEHAGSMLSMLGTGSTDTAGCATSEAEPGCDACSCGRRCSTG